MMPSCDQTGTPGLVSLTHFHSSTTSGSAALITARMRESISPFQPPTSLILASIIAAGASAFFELFGIVLSPPAERSNRRSSTVLLAAETRSRGEFQVYGPRSTRRLT